MRITIDECMDELQKLKLPISKHDLSFHFVEHTRNETLDMAIDIMRKYRKIEQILKETHEGCITKYQKIEEVIENEEESEDKECQEKKQ